MKSEFFIDALEFLDDQLLIEAGEKRVNRKKIIYLRTAAAAAACVLLLIIVGLVARSPFTESPKLLTGKDWRLLREDNLWFPVETENPRYVVTATETPTPTAEITPLKPTKRPTVTKRPGANTTTPATTNPVVNPTAPGGNGYNEPDPIPPQDDIPSPTSAVLTEEPEEWTTYITKSEITEGTYLAAENFVMAWFASALNVEYVEPTATPEPTPEPTPVPTPEPTPVPTPVTTDMPTVDATTFPGDTPNSTMNPAPPEVTNTPSTEPTATPPIETEPTKTPAPSEPEQDNPTSPGDDDKNDAPTAAGNYWKYTLGSGTAKYTWQKREIPTNAIKSYVGTKVLNGVSGRNQTESTSVSAYSIKGVSTDFALAAKVKGVSGYYLFINKSYVPKTFKAYVTDLNLKENLKWDTLAVYGNKLTTTSVSSDKIWGILSNADGKVVDAKNIYMKNAMVAALTMDIEMYGYYDIPVALYKEGYVIISLFDQTYAFYIGEAKVAEILK